jgi:aspartate/glutamate racemase
MRSLQFREAFAKYGVEATGPADEAVRAMTTELVADLQRGRLAGASDRLVQIARRSFDSQFGRRPIVYLACTELPLAFEAMKTLPIFRMR